MAGFPSQICADIGIFGADFQGSRGVEIGIWAESLLFKMNPFCSVPLRDSESGIKD